jgi:hypothetical protein
MTKGCSLQGFSVGRHSRNQVNIYHDFVLLNRILAITGIGVARLAEKGKQSESKTIFANC